MIQTIIFSYDRAMQLSLLLESIHKYDTGNRLEVSVLYNYSSPDYGKAYDLLAGRYPSVRWIKEENYTTARTNCDFSFFYWHNVYWWLKNKKLRKNKTGFKKEIVREIDRSSAEYLMFLTDDSLFVRDITVPKEVLDQIREHPRDCSFSFRLGKNLTGGKITREEAQSIRWNVYENDPATDWGCPFSVDGHVYSKSVLSTIIKAIVFNNPNTMEPNMGCYIRERQLFSTIQAPLENALCGFELNRVQQIISNHHLGISAAGLNDYFLKGYTLAISFDDRNPCHFRPEIQAVSVLKEEESICLYHLK